MDISGQWCENPDNPGIMLEQPVPDSPSKWWRLYDVSHETQEYTYIALTHKVKQINREKDANLY